MFYGEYNRWRNGPHRYLYERDKGAFKEKFGEYVETIRQNNPREYVLGLMRQIAVSWGKVPCIIFDNADHFDVPFQESVFNYANSIYSRSMCLLIIPITDTTSWQLPKQGPLQSFHSESFFLPTPPTELVLQRRIEFIEKKVAEEKPERGRGYFTERGIRLELDNLRAFTASLQKIFLSTGQVAEWIGRLANNDVRRSLHLTREIVSSPHIKVIELVTAFIKKSALEVTLEDIKLAIIRGKYDVYPVATNAFVQNVFHLVGDADTTPLLPLRILEFLRGAWASNPDNDRRYVSLREIQAYFQEIGIDSRVTLQCLDSLLQTGLVLEYDPTAKTISEDGRVQVAPSGRQHLIWGLGDWVYIESMATTTPLLDQTVFEAIKAHSVEGRTDSLREVIHTFIRHLLSEDSFFVTVPKHVLYEGQTKIADKLRQQLDTLTAFPRNGRIGRYARNCGKVKRWDRDRGFGFVQQEVLGRDAFLHISDVLNPRQDYLELGALVEYDLCEDDPEKPKALNAIELAT